MNKPTRVNKLVSAAIVAVIVAGFFWLSIYRSGITINMATIWAYRGRFFDGFVMTIIISLGALAMSLLLGLITAALRRSQILVLRYLALTYVEAIRGTPLLVQIYLFYYLIGTAWGVENRYVAGILVLSIFEAAYVAEIIRGAWQSIDRQTFEVAKSLGLDKWKTFKLVTHPLLLQRSVPALAGQAASIIKDSSLLSVVAVAELTQATQEISAENFQLFANYLLLGVLYFVLTFPISMLSKWLERRVGRAFGTAEDQ